MQQFCPTVSWGQKKNLVLLKVHLKDMKDHEVNVSGQSITFSAFGIGANGENTYKFTLNLFDSVAEKPSITVTPGSGQIVLTKSKSEEPWPRLTKEKAKLPWLRVDFDYLETEDADSESEGADDEADSGDFNVKNVERLLKNPREVKREMMTKLSDNLKKIYLFSYNTFLWLTFCAIFLNLAVTMGVQHMTEAFYVNTEFLLKLAQGVMFLEVLNAAFKLTKTSVIPSLMQIGGRGLLIFVIIPNEPRLQTSVIVLVLFFTFSTIEIVRYPYYILQVFSKEWYPLTWLRYSVWIVFYPIGMCLEATVLYLFVTHRAETMFEPSIASFASFIMIPVILLMVIIDYTLLRYMWRQRVKKIGGGGGIQRSFMRRGPPRKPKAI